MRRLFADVPRAQLVGDAAGQRCEQSHHWAEHAAPRGPRTRRLGGVMTALHALGGLPAAQVEDSAQHRLVDGHEVVLGGAACHAVD